MSYSSNDQQKSPISEEADLHHHFTKCKKKATHSNFISFNIFSMEHLPEGHRDKDLYSFIKATGDLIVRISVNMVSGERPEFFPNTRDPFPFSDIKGSTSLRTGSGEISMLKFIDGLGCNGFGNIYNHFGKIYEREYSTCPCKKCQHSDKPSNIWWEIIVITSAHVVFDAIEARHTTCRLFFDDQNSPLVVIDNLNFCGVNVEHDMCVLKYVTCEPLGNQLYMIEKQACALWKNVDYNYRYKLNDNLCFIVSHPHGCSKQVSIGHWIEYEENDEYIDTFHWSKLAYTASTCRGSSGARVWCAGYGAGLVHCGHLEGEFNYCRIALIKSKFLSLLLQPE